MAVKQWESGKRNYFLFNYDNDFRTMIDNNVIGFKGDEIDLTLPIKSQNPEEEVDKALSSSTLIDPISKRALKDMIFNLKIGDIVCLSDNDSVKAIGIIESNYFFRRNKELPHARVVHWIDTNKISLTDGNQRKKVRPVEKEGNIKLLEGIVDNIIANDDSPVTINYISRITVEKYVDFLSKVNLNPHEMDLLNLIYHKDGRGITLFGLQKRFDGIDVQESLEVLARKISKRFNLKKIDGSYIPNIFDYSYKDGYERINLKRELTEALSVTGIVDYELEGIDTDYNINDATLNSIYPPEMFEEALNLMHLKKNINLSGGWGTGKSYFAKRLAYLIIGNRNSEFILSLRMHPSQDYRELLYPERPRILYRFIEQARKNLLDNYVIILEDCHLVNLNEVLGEIVYLMQDNNREKEDALDVSFTDNKFYLPKNIYVIETSRDNRVKNIEEVDLTNVLFIEMKALFNNRFINMFKDKEFGTWIANTYSSLNERIDKYGISFNHGLFLKASRGVNLKEYKVILKYKVLPILRRVLDDKEFIEEETYLTYEKDTF